MRLSGRNIEGEKGEKQEHQTVAKESELSNKRFTRFKLSTNEHTNIFTSRYNRCKLKAGNDVILLRLIVDVIRKRDLYQSSRFIGNE